VERRANQVSGTFSGGTVSGSDGQSNEDRLCFCRQCEDFVQLQTPAKIPAFFSVSQVELARLTLKLLKIEPPFVIAIDRTEWQLGKSWVNVLLLSVSYKRVAIPLIWTVWEEKGCSDNRERREIVERFIEEFGRTSIRFVTADREFASQEWLAYLVQEQIGFRLRIKANARITDKRGRVMRASQLWKRMPVGARMECRRRRKLWEQKVFVAVCRKEDGEAVIVISSERSGKILLEYGRRWEIETLFGNLKRRGFNLEETHLTEAERVSRLLSLLALAGCWALLAGEMAMSETPLKIKKHGRAEKSVFRLGFETLRSCFCRIQINLRQKQQFQQITLLLSCT
jgi:hypothetical protein